MMFNRSLVESQQKLVKLMENVMFIRGARSLNGPVLLLPMPTLSAVAETDEILVIIALQNAGNWGPKVCWTPLCLYFICNVKRGDKKKGVKIGSKREEDGCMVHIGRC